MMRWAILGRRGMVQAGACWWSLAAAGCVLVSDLDHDEDTAGAGGATSSSTSSTAASGLSTGGGGGAAGDGGAATGSGGDAGRGGGGSGGAPPCGGADLLSDPENCGACGFSCGDESCTDGRCAVGEPLGLGGGTLSSAVVHGDELFFVQRDTNAPDSAGALYVVPTDFGPRTVPRRVSSIVNATGALALGVIGERRVYFGGQASTSIYACSSADCVTVDLGDQLGFQVNGLTAVGGLLYVLEPHPGDRLFSTPIDAVTGVPAGTLTPLVVSYAPPIVNAGVVGLAHQVDPSRLIWTSYELPLDPGEEPTGCLYRAETADLPVTAGGLPCWTPTYVARAFVAAPGGSVFVHDDTSVLFEVVGDPPALVPFTDDATGPSAADDRFVYVTSVATRAIRAIPLEGGEPAGATAIPSQAPWPLSASHPDYLFYGVGNTLHRWPKPPSP